MPGSSRSWGARRRASFSISRASSRSSQASCRIRRATAFRARCVPRSSGSWRRSGRVVARCASSRARLSGRSSARSGSGAVTSRSRSWESAAVVAVTAPSRAAIRVQRLAFALWLAAAPAACLRAHSGRRVRHRARLSRQQSDVRAGHRKPRIQSRRDRLGSGRVPPRTLRHPRPRRHDGRARDDPRAAASPGSRRCQPQRSSRAAPRRCAPRRSRAHAGRGAGRRIRLTSSRALGHTHSVPGVPRSVGNRTQEVGGSSPPSSISVQAVSARQAMASVDWCVGYVWRRTELGTLASSG